MSGIAAAVADGAEAAFARPARRAPRSKNRRIVVGTKEAAARGELAEGELCEAETLRSVRHK